MPRAPKRAPKHHEQTKQTGRDVQSEQAAEQEELPLQEPILTWNEWRKEWLEIENELRQKHPDEAKFAATLPTFSDEIKYLFRKLEDRDVGDEKGPSRFLLEYLGAIHQINPYQFALMPELEVLEILEDDYHFRQSLKGPSQPPRSSPLCPQSSDNRPSERQDDQQATESKTAESAKTKTKRSTEKGEGQRKLIAALTKYHQYADGSCLNLEPIGNNELARLAEVEESTASDFFKKEFQGHAQYKAFCRRDKAGLIAAIKQLNKEFHPYLLYGRRPPDEGDGDKDE
jgi:hypothetical protein